MLAVNSKFVSSRERERPFVEYFVRIFISFDPRSAGWYRERGLKCSREHYSVGRRLWGLLRTAHIEQVPAIEEQESSEFMKRSNRQVDETLVILFKIIEIGHEPQFSNRTALVVEMFYHSKRLTVLCETKQRTKESKRKVRSKPHFIDQVALDSFLRL